MKRKDGQGGKDHLYGLLCKMGLTLHLKEGWQTKALRDTYGLRKTKRKSRPSFESHAVDAWVLAASHSGAKKPTCTRLWYLVPARLHRRQLHRLQASKGGIRKPYGGTRLSRAETWNVSKTRKVWLVYRWRLRPQETDD